ncbi:SRPBCC family protein [Streptomyces platensis]|uniref:SRPBCC family protein n=1 Tax=Streptomyces platensis TaxID=58346 RepID=UPI001F3188CA|nr:SRPBCC family protein [Streptomyces platensis]MCF3141982.1 SRPBCC domain-containing protein [Streptomyces platensis]
MKPHSDTLTTGDGRSALRMERRLAHPPAKVWSAITDPAHIGQWFPSEVTVELRPGGAMTFTMAGVSDIAMTGTVTDAEEPRLFAFTWGEDHLRWEISPDGDGSLLVLVHTFGDRFGGASFASGWHLCLTALAQLLDGESPHVERDTGELHEAYLEQFDLGRGVVEDTADGPRVRFERQLVRSTETVWAALTSGDEPAAGAPAPAGFTSRQAPDGPVTEVTAPALLAYRWHPEGTVRWELGQGTGHGPRLVLTQTGPQGFDAAAALDAWHERIGQLAAQLMAD